MQALRNATRLARLVLAWFGLSVAVAMASPLVNPQSFELICSSAGAVKFLITGTDDSQAPSALHTLDCPLCACSAGPLPLAPSVAAPSQPLGYACQSIPCAHIAARIAAPLPARGPPVLLSIQ
jgi:hypothetical protein